MEYGSTYSRESMEILCDFHTSGWGQSSGSNSSTGGEPLLLHYRSAPNVMRTYSVSYLHEPKILLSQVLVRSAILCSSAMPYLLPPQPLLIKDPETGVSSRRVEAAYEIIGCWDSHVSHVSLPCVKGTKRSSWYFYEEWYCEIVVCEKDIPSSRKFSIFYTFQVVKFTIFCTFPVGE